MLHSHPSTLAAYTRRCCGLFVAVLLFATLAGCGQAATTTSMQGVVVPQFAFSEAVVGPNRIALGLVRDQTPLNDPGAKVHLRLFGPSNTSGTPDVESDATYYGQGLPVGFYVAYPTLKEAGDWRIEIRAQASGQTQTSVSKQRLLVKEKSDVPNVGDPAPPVKTLTVNDVPDVAQLSSGKPVDQAMYQISLDKALQSGKPTVLLFATPSFCRSATCGPSLSVVEALQKQYSAQLNFIHVEVYKYPFADSFTAQQAVFSKATQEQRDLTQTEMETGFSEPMVAWKLLSEPWLYLIDAKGMIAARYEGGITEQELTPALQKLTAGEPVILAAK